MSFFQFCCKQLLPLTVLLWASLAFSSGDQQFQQNSSKPLSPGQFYPDGKLAGQWFAVPGKLIPPDQIADHQQTRHLVSVPGYWDTDKLGLAGARGLVTLWADLKLDAKLPADTLYAIWPGRFQSASRIYINNGQGDVLKVFDNLSVHIPEKDTIQTQLPQNWVAGELHYGGARTLRLSPGSQIIIQMFNEDYLIGGAARAPMLGPADDMHRLRASRFSFHLVVFGACILVLVYSLSLAYFSSAHRPLQFFLILMTIGAGTRLMITGDLLQQTIFTISTDDNFYMSWLSFLSLLAVFIGCQVYALPQVFQRYPKVQYIFLSLSAIPVVLFCLAFIIDMQTFLYIGHGVRAFFVVAALSYAVFLAVQLYYHRGFALEFCCLIIILVGGAFDSYIYSQNKDPYIELFSLAVFLFILVQASRLGWGYVKLLGSEKRLSLRLQDLNESLEAKVTQRTQELELANVSLAKAAATDSLTKLPNRRDFDLEIVREMRRAERNQSQLCLAIADVDWFKTVNDNYGHQFGDQVLQRLAAGLRDRLRITDYVARIGGEEFAIILPGSDLEMAGKVLEELRQNIKALVFEELPSYRISLSIGCCQWQQGLDEETVYKYADQALYLAKESGRGKVVSQNGQPLKTDN